MTDPDRELTRWGSRFDAAMGPEKDAMTLKQERRWREIRGRLPMLLDEQSAVMTRATFLQLDEYSCSIPSGVFAGKIWRCRQPFLVADDDPRAEHWLGEYVDTGAIDMRIFWRRIYIVEETPAA